MSSKAHHSSSRFGVLAAVLLLAMLILNGCAQAQSPEHVDSTQPVVTPTILPVSGWQTYTDTQYHFRTVIPPGWHVGALLDTRLESGDCAYEVIYFPPGDTHTAEPLVTMHMNEFMLIQVNLHCAGVALDHLTPDGHMTISGAQADLYKSPDESQGVHRVAYAEFGGHSYDFVLADASAAHTPIIDHIPLYLAILHNFSYLG
jgi:hypothetical protein